MMNPVDITEEKLNLFIDEQLDVDEMDEMHQLVIENDDLRVRVCQLKAVRELVGYAYSNVPDSPDNLTRNKHNTLYTRAIAASLVLVTGVLLGWVTYDYSPNAIKAVSAENAFQYIANHATVDHEQRNIILHVDSGDMKVVNSVLNEADYLIATYRQANIPIKVDVIANKAGINMLRPNISPYADRIQRLIDEEGVSVYACQRSIMKAQKKEGGEVTILPGVTTNETARELIPERLEKGWVYIKA